MNPDISGAIFTVLVRGRQICQGSLIDPDYVPFSQKRFVVYFFKVFENGMKYQLSQIIEEHLSFLEDDGVDYSEFLKSPNYPAKTFSMPSKSSLLGGF